MVVKNNGMALVGIVLISFVAFLEYTVVNTALPTIQTQFHVSILKLQWVFNIYSIVVALTMVIFGRLGDLYGRRFIFYVGAFLLALGSVGAGMADSFGFLIFSRAVQSLGVAATITLGPTLINVIFRDRANIPMSIFSMFTGVGLAIGPYLGGVIVTHIGWRWIFYINIPLLIFAFLFCLPCLPESKADEKVSIDIVGTILLACTMLGLILGFIHGEQVGWDSAVTIIAFIVFIIALPLLFIYENTREMPILDFHYFKRPVFAISGLSCMMGGTLVAVALLFSPLYLQRVLHYSPTNAGMILLAIPIAVVLFSMTVGKLTQKIGVSATMVWGIFISIMTAVLYLLIAKTNSLALIVIAFFGVGLAWAFNNVSTPIGAAEAVDSKHLGVALGTIFSIWNISSGIMIAITTVIFHWATQSNDPIHIAAYSFKHGFTAIFIFVLIMLILIFSLSLKIYFSGKKKIMPR